MTQTLAGQGIHTTRGLSGESAATATVTELAAARLVTKLSIGDRIAVLARRVLDAEVTGITTYCPPDHGERHHVIRWQAGRAAGEFLRRDGETVTLAIDVEQVCREITDLTGQIYDLRMCEAAALDGTPFPDAPDLFDAARDLAGLEGKRDNLEELLSCLAAAFAPAAPEPAVLTVAA